jgi:hypothetical protein
MKVKLGYEQERPLGSPDEFGGQVVRTDWVAGSENATKALEQHLRTVRNVLNGEASLNDLGGSYDALQAEPETAALIRQAEDSGST